MVDEMFEEDDLLEDEDQGDDEPEAGLPVVDRSGAASFVTGLVIGTALGAAVALLLAPAAGDVTRRRLRRRADDLRDRAEAGAGELSRRARRRLASLRR